MTTATLERSEIAEIAQEESVEKPKRKYTPHKQRTTKLKDTIMQHILSTGSSTQDEAVVALNEPNGSITPRFAQLEKAGLIEKRQDSITEKWMTRTSRCGKQVWVYFAVPQAAPKGFWTGK